MLIIPTDKETNDLVEAIAAQENQLKERCEIVQKKFLRKCSTLIWNTPDEYLSSIEKYTLGSHHVIYTRKRKHKAPRMGMRLKIVDNWVGVEGITTRYILYYRRKFYYVSLDNGIAQIEKAEIDVGEF